MLPPSPIEETALALLSAVLLAVLLLWMTGCAHVDRAQSLDGLTTAIALENGFTTHEMTTPRIEVFISLCYNILCPIRTFHLPENAL